MSEAAPSTGGPATPSPAPTAVPAEQPAATAQPESRITSPTVPDKPTSKKGLPGVITHERTVDEQKLADDLFGEPGEGDRKTRLRGPDGKFVKSDAAPDAAAPEKPQLPEGVEPPKEESKKFKFAGKEYEKLEDAEQRHRTLEGMYRSQTEQLRDISNRHGEAYAAYTAWKKYGEEQAAEVTRLKTGGVVPSQPGSGQQPGQEAAAVDPQDIKKLIDMDAFEYIAAKGSLGQAGEYLVSELLRVMNEQILPGKLQALEQKLAQRVAPFEQQASYAQMADAMTRVTEQVSALRTEDGNLAFPELRDPEAIEKIGEMWADEAETEQEFDQRLKMLNTPRGLISAISLYRLAKQLEGATASPATAAPGQPALPATPVAPGAAASVSVDGGTSRITPQATRTNLPPGLAALVSGLNKVEMVDRKLGFARNV